MDSCVLALFILAVAVFFFVTELIPVPVTAISAALAMGLCGIIPPQDVFSGFSHDITVMIIGTMIVGEALCETGADQRVGSFIVRIAGIDERRFLAVCVIITSLLSAFLSNTAIVAIMLPVVTAASVSSKGRIKKKSIYMAVGFAANIGGGMTLIGSTPNIIGQDLLIDAGVKPMGFFDLTWVSIPRLAFVILFYATVGYRLQEKVFDFEEVPTAPRQGVLEETVHINKIKLKISCVILACMMVGFISGVWTMGTVGLLAGMACIWTKCISVKRAFSRLDWSAVWTIAGSFGIAAGIDQSGAGALIANAVIGWFGGSVNMLALMVLFSVLSVIVGNLMSSSAAMAILGPIAIHICAGLGLEAKPVIMAIVWSLNLAFLSPIATPPVTMTLQGGYRFLDYTKVGLPLLLGCLFLTVMCYPLLV